MHRGPILLATPQNSETISFSNRHGHSSCFKTAPAIGPMQWLPHTNGLLFRAYRRTMAA
ncbi:hypothetical protein AtDm6_2199 [Acetobacter tropicalis]|uniref:Uncharacterized protein n=1 Tax=Acetobacter tropicalis TaxID=104102 RepID=A0A095B0U3_9PROT|nr:hypothetical protein AtDm6_2199 [Acetobacter tropicalis]